MEGVTEGYLILILWASHGCIEYHGSISVNGKEQEQETQVREGASGEKNDLWEGEMKFVISIHSQRN